MALRLLSGTRTALRPLPNLVATPQCLGISTTLPTIAAFRSSVLAQPSALRLPARLGLAHGFKTTALCAFRSTANSQVQPSSHKNHGLPESVPVHPINRSEGSYHWDFERALSVALIPLIGAQAAYGAHPVTDLLVGVVLPLHCHIGWSAMITDYIQARNFPRLNILSFWALRLFTVLTLVGCYQFNTNDIGLTELIKRSWKA
ncbi:membrane anchor subunit of succinate dehydrogenase, Sdh4 [Dimargaris xerosporica]|nr:membrane anchor subunit of succinate dehydrogenase, Sdh4 [Dimargaris xerosporica]